MEQQFQVSGGQGAAGANGGAPAPGTAAIDRGADLLVRVLESEEPVALTDLASAAGLPKSTASRLVSALERRGLIEQDGERGRLRPGPAILRVAERSMLERNIVELSRPTLDALAEGTGETINLAVPGPAGVEHIAQVDSRHFLGAGQWLGRSVGYAHSANGKVFAAFGRAPASAAGATTSRELQSVRRNGFAMSIDELEIGLSAIAAPVRGARGEVIAALSISGPTLRMTPARIDELRPMLIGEARTLSRRLGHRDQGERAA
ncbi:MAG: IclR family transcriptional regulator [Solirubrobacterales bacterium]|nr:IclR family transcriptional regulator [Solirubrobacterales bacterium]